MVTVLECKEPIWKIRLLPQMEFCFLELFSIFAISWSLECIFSSNTEQCCGQISYLEFGDFLVWASPFYDVYFLSLLKPSVFLPLCVFLFIYFFGLQHNFLVEFWKGAKWHHLRQEDCAFVEEPAQLPFFSLKHRNPQLFACQHFIFRVFR